MLYAHVHNPISNLTIYILADYHAYVHVIIGNLYLCIVHWSTANTLQEPAHLANTLADTHTHTKKRDKKYSLEKIYTCGMYMYIAPIHVALIQYN